MGTIVAKLKLYSDEDIAKNCDKKNLIALTDSNTPCSTHQQHVMAAKHSSEISLLCHKQTALPVVR